MNIELYSDKNEVARKIWASIGKHTITMELQDLGKGMEYEESITIRLPEFKKATRLETEDEIYAFLRKNFGSNNAMDKMERFLDIHDITYNLGCY